MKRVLLILIAIVFARQLLSQSNAFFNSSFENYSGCVSSMSPSHSQFGNVVFAWENAFPSNVSTADFFTDGSLCSFTSYSSLTNTVTLASNTASKGCSWAGIYLNYYDTASINTKYREYIAQNISLIPGTSYTVKLDLARSNHSSSNNLEVDLGIYGYNGTMPAGQLDYCLINADGSPSTLLGTINRNSIGTAFQTFQTSFTPTQNFDYIVIGGASCGTEATDIGYVFIDNVQLTASNNSIVNPVIESSSNNGLCGLHCLKQSFNLVGNVSQSGITSTWSQSLNNPEQVTFSSPNSSTTTILESGSFITGTYEFYYTFSNGVTSVTDTAFIDIYEYSIVNSFTAGPDINFCNGNLDSTGQQRGVQISGAFPDITEMNEYGASGWWSMIRNDGTEWRFPNGCHPGDGFDEGDVYTLSYPNMQCNNYIPYSSNSNQVGFYFRNPQDTVQFIWHIEATDDCNTSIFLVDTLEVFYNDVDFPSTTTLFPYTSVCQGSTMTIAQESSTPNVLPLYNKPNLSFLWSYTPSNGGLTIINNSVSDSAQMIGNIVGDYIVKLQVFDAATGCSWYDLVDVNVSDCSISAGVDMVIGCDTNRLSNDSPNDSYGTISKALIRRVNMDAIPTDITIQDNNMGSWWSMIRDDGTEWVFPNNCVSYDGYDEGDVFSVNSIRPCAAPTYGFPSSSNALFNFRNAIDTVTFIWHVTTYDSISGVTSLLEDTMVVVMKDVDFPYSSYANPEVPWRTFCEDTLLIHQHIAPSFRPLGREENLVFKWDVVQPFGNGFVPVISNDAYIVDDAVSDSALLVTSVGRKFQILLKVTDTLTGCSWMDFIVVKRVMPIDVDAGSDSFECVQNTGDYIFQADADLWYQGLNSDTITTMSTWWTTINDDGSEWVFPNGCIPSDGPDQGGVYVLNSSTTNCNSVPNPGESNAKDCIFGFRFPGERKLIWHALDCTGQISSDTILVGYGVLDQANAGLDVTTTCNVVTLEGNLSSLSSANSGYYYWEQLSGPDTVDILNSTVNIGYFSTANLSSGTYSFQYTLGLYPCQTTDTVEVTVNPTPNLLIDMTSNYNPTINYCQTDTITFIATGGLQYAFLVDGIIVQPFSPIGSFSYSEFNGLNEVTVLGMTGVNGCIETLDSAHVIEVQYLSPPDISQFPSQFCEGEQVRLNLPSRPNGMYTWFGPNGPMNNDSVFEITYVSAVNTGEYLISYSENSCYSDTANFNLSVSPTYEGLNSLFACANDSVLFEGVYYSQSVSFTDTLQTSFGCDSIINTDIVIGDTIYRYIEICNGDSVFLSGAYQESDGVFIDSYTINASCDSVIKTELSLLPNYRLNLDSTICFGDSIYFSNSFIHSSGLYVDSLLSSNGCDSLIQMDLSVLPLNKTVFSTTICIGDSILIFNQYQSQTGVYSETHTSNLNCDSIIEFQLFIQDEQTVFQTQDICAGDSVFLENAFQFNAGIYNDTLSSQFGCDSIIQTSLIVHQHYLNQDSVVSCGSYFWPSSSLNYNESGDYVSVFNSEFGCDSILNLNLEILPIKTSSLALPFFCDSAYLKDRWYFNSQTIIDTLESESGCDSLVFIALDIRDCSTTANFSDLYIPNVFTPNNDGVNDSFIITSLGEIIEEGAKLEIYNRWGIKLFESTSLIKWDGNNHSDGTYYYIFNYKGNDYTGHVNLIRG